MAESEQKKQARTRTTSTLAGLSHPKWNLKLNHVPPSTGWEHKNRRKKLHTRKSHTILTSLSNTYNVELTTSKSTNAMPPHKAPVAGINFELVHLVRGGSHIGRVKSRLRQLFRPGTWMGNASYALDGLARNRVVNNITTKSFCKDVVGLISSKMKTCRKVSHE